MRNRHHNRIKRRKARMYGLLAWVALTLIGLTMIIPNLGYTGRPATSSQFGAFRSGTGWTITDSSDDAYHAIPFEESVAVGAACFRRLGPQFPLVHAKKSCWITLHPGDNVALTPADVAEIQMQVSTRLRADPDWFGLPTSNRATTREVLWALSALSWLLLFAWIACLPILIRAAFHLVSDPPAGMCPSCQYKVTGLASTVCPECGAKV